MYKIKQIPEDFIVDEITNIKPQKSGRYIYYKLKKTNYTVLRALEHIAAKLRIPLKKIGFAGTKDKLAITTQFISFDSVKKEKIDNITLKDIKLEFFGYGDEPISLGDLEANQFCIIIRNMEKKPKSITELPNCFGPQRFSDNNTDIGKSIIKKDFRKAAEMIAESDNQFTTTSMTYLKERPNDYIGLIRQLPKKLLMLYIHSYQSYIWNETVRQLITKGIEKDRVEIIGFATELKDDEEGNIIKSIINKDNISQRDFIIRSMPELSSEGTQRDMYIKVMKLNISAPVEDDMNKGKKKYKIKFILPKGSYATIVIDQIAA
ncbi:MAG: tRNA pseudouridine(13) synthase TruD [Nanoarchaeota archaeon]|nr:tRNA pseudouridine(13) synthase TruD [Nanoarchaeota archaeon]